MLDAIAHVLAVVGEAGSGEGSPLSANSPYSEFLRLAQLAVIGGMMYLIREFKNKREDSAHSHGQILGEIELVKKVAEEAKALAQSNYEANRTLITTVQGEIKDELKAIHTEVKTP